MKHYQNSALLVAVGAMLAEEAMHGRPTRRDKPLVMRSEDAGFPPKKPVHAQLAAELRRQRRRERNLRNAGL